MLCNELRVKTSRLQTVFSRQGQEILQGVFQRVVQFHDGRLVAAAVAVVRGREDRHHIPEGKKKQQR